MSSDTKKKYTITITFEADYVPSDIMDDLCGVCLVQVQGLNDGTMEDDEGDQLNIAHENSDVNWVVSDVSIASFISSVNKTKSILGESCARRQLVVGLYNRNLLYHFDDSAVECLHSKEVLCTLEEAKLIEKTVIEMYGDGEELFAIALEVDRPDYDPIYT